MSGSALVVRLRPTGPWRLGPESGARERVENVLHSDSLYSALTCAMNDLGLLSDWLQATAESPSPDVRISSGFPFVGQSLFVPPPRHTWPPATTGKVRWKAARLVPLSLAPALLRDEDLETDRWTADPVSQCLLPVGKHGVSSPPFRVSLRQTAPVDRINLTSSEAFFTACLEFTPGSGIWCLVTFENDAAQEKWSPHVRSAFRLLADSGIGGERSLGWGRSKSPQFQEVSLPEFLTGNGTGFEAVDTGFWLLSLFSPAPLDSIDWGRGDYAVVTRSGRAESRARHGELKRSSRMVEEGSVIFAGAPPVGAARDVAPDGFPHPLYRAGYAVAVAVPVREQGIKYRPSVPAPEPEPEPEAEPQEPLAEEQP
jgi:CRISPR type III-A-associated RAMP protein Csm4